MKKRIAVVLAAVILMGLVACTETSPGNMTTHQSTSIPTAPVPTTTQAPEPEVYDISIWVPIGYVEITQKQIENFNALYAGQYRFNATVLAESEPVNKIHHKGVPAPDLFCFTSDDNVEKMVGYGLLSPLWQEEADYIRGNHHANAVASATVADQLYAYPVSTQPSYIVYYDKSAISEADMDSLEAMLAACETSGRKFSCVIDGSFASYFFAAMGCISDWSFNGEGDWTSVEDTYNSPEGIVALGKIQTILNSPAYRYGMDMELFQGENASAVLVTSIWHLLNGSAREILGDNLGIAALPSFEHNGNSHSLLPDSYDWLLGISPQEDGERLAALQTLARYLTDDACQLERFTQQQLLPSNLLAQQAVAAEDPHWGAVFRQSCLVRQFRHGSWWQYMENMLYQVRTGTSPEDALRAYEWSVKDLFRDYTWSVIGGYPGMSWGGYCAMVAQPDGTYRTEEALYFEEKTEFIVLKDRRWDVSYGADGQLNGPYIKPGVTGYFYVVFDPATGLCQLESA